MNPLALYPTTVPSTVLPAAAQLVDAFDGQDVAWPQTFIGKSLGFGELPSQGSELPWPAKATAPNPTGQGYLLDDARLEGQTIAAGDWAAQSYHVMRSACVTDCVMRVFLFNILSASFTLVGLFLAPGVVWVTGGRVSPPYPALSLPAIPCGSGDRLYLDVLFDVTTHAHDPKNFTDTELSTGVSGAASATVLVTTPGYAATV